MVPVYGCADSLADLADRLDKALASISTNYEVVLVDDASPDGAWAVIRQLAQLANGNRSLRITSQVG